MKHPEYEELNDWIDRSLSDVDAAAIALHVEQCSECAATVARLRELLGATAQLPKSIEPPAFVWENIQAKTTRNRWSAVRQLRYPLAAAAIIVIALSSAITTLVMRKDTPAPVAVTTRPPALPSDVQLVLRRVEKDYGESVRALEALVEAQRSTMDTATLNLLDSHMKLIDDAIGQAKVALQKQPDNEQLPHMITGAYERKVTMLKRALRTERKI